MAKTLTLMGAALNENVLPLIGKVVLCGTMAFGEAGVLLAVGDPVSTVAFPP